MPAVSKAQQRFMAMVAHHPEKLRGGKPKGLSREEALKFAKTPRKGLPEHKTKTSKTMKALRRATGKKYT